jgi:hypothetical protein
MDGSGTTGNFSNRAHRRVQHNGIAGPDAELAKVVRQFLDQYIANYLKGNCPANGAIQGDRLRDLV